ncbi:protein transporter SEC9 [Amanita rubescens]|nr:protein transporter SEC9 [Amanita rubescens]
MPLFKCQEKVLIPPVPGSTTIDNPSPRQGPKSHANTYVRSRDGDPYNFPTRSAVSTPSDANALRDRYGRNDGVGDVYSRGGADIVKDRSELFAGYKPQSQSNRFAGGPADNEGNDEDVEGIKSQTRFIKQDSVNTTRNALRLAREAEETARNTLTKIGDQSEKLASTERHLDVAKGHSQRATDKTDELKQLNRSIFRPVITFNKDAKRAAQEAEIQARYEEERLERERAMKDIRETQNRLGRAATYGRNDEEGIGGRLRTAEQLGKRKEERKRYQFEAEASDDELEDQIDDNLDEISDATKRLKALAMGMGQELDTQIQRIERIDNKTLNLDNKVLMNTERLKKIK